MLILRSRFIWLLTACALLAGVNQAARANTEIKDIFQSELACAIVEPLLADMPIEPLFSLQGSNCIGVAAGDAASGSFYTDSSCTQSIVFSPTTLQSHCSVLLDPSQLGEGQGIAATATWTLPPGTRLDVGARSLDGVHQPYLQRRIYRTIDTAGGSCSLEMRIYARHPAVSGQRSLLALHGGSWSARGFGFFGLELTIPHFVEQGFVVYAPFYRLLGDSEGSVACHNATIAEVTDDASAALDWVREHADEYGSNDTPVVFGQSAGAHLAASLAVNEPESVAAAVLFYPPTDFTDFALRVRGGYYTNSQGLGILERVIQSTAAEADISASPIAENSFPIRIVESGLDLPPVLMVHGMADELVEARQSVRLCDALAGRQLLPVEVEVEPLDNLRQSLSCGADSQLQLIREGQHALDVCFADSLIATDLCPSGSEDSRTEVAEAIADAAMFAARHGPIVSAGQEEPGNGESEGEIGSRTNSGGATCYLLILILGLYALQKKCLKTRFGVATVPLF